MIQYVIQYGIVVPLAIIIGLIVLIQFAVIVHQRKMLDYQHMIILMMNNGELDRKIKNIINKIEKEEQYGNNSTDK